MKTYATADTDLDVHSLIKDLDDENVVFYFRAGAEDSNDFLYYKGCLDLGAETLAELMRQNEDLQYLIRETIINFQG